MDGVRRMFSFNKSAIKAEHDSEEGSSIHEQNTSLSRDSPKRRQKASKQANQEMNTRERGDERAKYKRARAIKND